MSNGSSDSGKPLIDRGLQRVGESMAATPRGTFEAVLIFAAALALVYLFVAKSPYYAIGAVVVLFAVLFLLRKPILLSYTLLLLVPLYWLNLLGRSLRVITVLTLIAVAYHTVKIVLAREPLRFNRVYFALGLYLVSCALSLVNSSDVELSYLGTKYFLLAIAMGWVLIVSVRTKEQLRVLFMILLAWGVAQAILGMLQTFVSIKFFPAYYFHTFGLPIVDAYSVGGVRRASGTFQIGPRYAMFLMLPLAIMVAGFMSRTIFHRRTWLMLLAPFVFGIFVSLTRIAIALSLVFVVFYNFFARRRQALMGSVAGLLVLGILVGTVALIIPADVKYALGKRFGEEDDEVYKDRLYFLWNALGAFTENPLLGIGVGTYESRSWEFMQKYPVPWRQVRWDIAAQRNMPESVPVHNEYGRMLAEQGIFSIPIFLFLLYTAFRNLSYAYRHTKDEFVRTMALGLSMLLLSMSVYWYFHEYFMEEPYTSILPFAFSVIIYNLVRDEQEASPDNAQA
ncbi:MAG TPA: O-antigen ligase family protein [bacterium]|nr:O-antigen ligase family protein [bacterium]